MIAKAAENAKSDVSKKEEVDPYPQEDGGSAGASDWDSRELTFVPFKKSRIWVDPFFRGIGFLA